MPTRDELLQIYNAKAGEAAARQIANDYEANTTLYYESLAAQKFDDAAYHMREARRLEGEIASMQAAQQQQSQQQFTEVEQQILREFPGIASDPKKFREAIAASQALQLRGYDRNSAAYDNAMRVAVGIVNPDGSDGNEIASGDTALAAVNNSQIARKYGPVDAGTYNRNAQWLYENKGIYKPRE